MTEMESVSSISLVSDEELSFFFVTEAIDKENNCATNASELMNSCFKTVAENFEVSYNKIEWITVADCCKLSPNSQTTKDIFILENFNTETLKFLQSTGALILGPLCVINCLCNGINVPSVSGPIFTNILQNLSICTTGMTAEAREPIKKLINFMGGNFEPNDMTLATTHLLVNKSLSPKYYKAQTQSNICMITPNWIYDLWEICQKTIDINKIVDLNLFTMKYKVGIFYNIGFTVTGLNSDEKIKLKTIIEKNGGKYFGIFQSKLIDILIMKPDQINSEKYKAAVKNKKICLNIEWIFDSCKDELQKPFKLYSIKSTANKTLDNNKLLVSTPRKNANPRASNFIGNDTATSNLSQILNTTVNDTIQSNLGNYSAVVIQKLENVDHLKKSYTDEFIKLTTKCKPRGQFLSGCNIFLCGFQLTEIEKIKEILRTSGCSIDRSKRSGVTFIIVGEPNENDLKYLNTMNCSKVKLSWLTASIEQKSPASDTEHLYQINQTIKQMNPPQNYNKSLTQRRLFGNNNNNNDDDDDDDDKGNDGDNDGDDGDDDNAGGVTVASDDDNGSNTNTTNKTTSNASDTNATNLTDDSIMLSFLDGLSIMDYGFVNESHDLIIQQIEAVGGKIHSIDSSNPADYLIVPVDIFELDDDTIKMGKFVVNELWLKESLGLQKCVKIEYYHQPIIVKNQQVQPLENVTAVLTIYSNEEREFLENLIHALGGRLNSQYVKSEKPILISPKPEGQKYEASIKWELPVVTSAWLMQCLFTWSKVSLNLYLVLPEDEDIIKATGKLRISTTSDTDSVFSNVLIPEEPITPVIRNRMFSDISNFAQNQFTPDVKISQREIYEDALSDLDTPERKKFVDMLLSSPAPERYKPLKDISTPDLVRHVEEVMKWTSESTIKAKNDAYLKSRVIKPKPKQITFTEVKNQFFKNILGDKYVGPNSSTVEEADSNSVDTNDVVRCAEHLESEITFPENEKQQMNVYFSSFSEDNIENLEIKLEKLNVKLFKVSYSNELTHVLCENLGRSESIFCGIAAGRWILSIKFIDDSFDSGNRLNEELYEWGNPKAEKNLPPLDGLTKSIAAAAYRWRTKLNPNSCNVSGGESHGAFIKFKVILHMQNKTPFKNLIESGGGIVLEISEPYAESEDILNIATHFICQPTLKPSDSDRKALLKANVLCVNHLYLEAYILFEDDASDPQKFCI